MNEKNEIYGIARCSTSKQDVEYEITELVKKGVPKENIFIEYITGKADLDKRVELDKLFKIVKPGISKIVATDITRIARNPKTFYEILEFIENNNLCLEIGTLICDCRNSELDIMTSTMLQVLSVFASFDIKMKTFQIKLGLRNAKEKNVKLGRKAITKKTLENAGFTVSTSAKPTEIVTEQFPSKGSELLKGSIIKLYTETENTRVSKKVPDLTNKSLSQVKSLLKNLNLNYSVTGSGTVVSQEPIANTQVEEGTVVKITLGN